MVVDLDEVLLLREPAWRYAIEEAVAATTGQRVDASRISAEYRFRPWRHALSVILNDAADLPRVEPLCRDIYERSAMKRLLVQDGIGMVLDRFRGEGVEVAAVSREPHHIARKQIESTGIDRFLAALSARGEGTEDVLLAVEDCLAFMEHEISRCALVSPDVQVLRVAEARGLRCFEAAWGHSASGAFPAFGAPHELLTLLDSPGGVIG
ncbi:MAG: HAD family hydrolase [Dehalococcoidia bacterium]